MCGPVAGETRSAVQLEQLSESSYMCFSTIAAVRSSIGRVHSATATKSVWHVRSVGRPPFSRGRHGHTNAKADTMPILDLISFLISLNWLADHRPGWFGRCVFCSIFAAFGCFLLVLRPSARWLLKELCAIPIRVQLLVLIFKVMHHATALIY